ncbi:RNA-directed DNA polymerase, eukaryota, reverse transcriptase zinc-binding domain protein [Tanacetum coccineum]|uniref:RNA-directed DNA polymerase, eukaryota, reverse transcriptase zinc-binding domain protein n=1 Tax=Tanacetum coccineum TaxID=301880 RepID=A0ABQ5INH4_9ASTR
MGDFNVTLKHEEHCAGSSVMTNDMQDFYDVVNELEVNDICSSGFFYTWTKSLRNPNNSILKKLDRMMSNEAFMEEFGNAHGVFLPYMVSDHSPSILCLPDKLPKVKKSFKFSNFVADKEEFKDIVKKARRHKTRIETIYDENGEGFNEELVAEQFVKHFKNFLEQAKLVKHLNCVGDIIKTKLCLEEVEEMAVEVTDNEIKAVIFDIDSNKAPGPDGFSACFFKKTWDIIGKDVCNAVKDFFSNGKLLGEVNATLIALVPKCHVPLKVSEFRPIACCNVIYKCISKIITNRIKNGLTKIVSCNQSAFVPGRHIQDNILITQELLRGYNRKNRPKRCAMKIDIQKAYDTVNWDFLNETLEVHGYFKGGRGLRQSDPMSPYLFTLVMEIFNLIMMKKIEEAQNFKYHFGCKEIKLTNICFADDLLVVCNGDKDSLEVVKSSLNEFSLVSELFPNLSKSTIYFGSINEKERSELLKICPREWYGKYPSLRNIQCLAIIENKKDEVLWLNRNGVSMPYSTKYEWKDLRGVWPVHELRQFIKLDKDYESMVEVVEYMEDQASKNKSWRVLNRLILAATTYYIWQERNGRVFKNKSRIEIELCCVIKENIKNKLMSLKVKRSREVVKIAEIWGLSWSNMQLKPVDQI